MEDRPDAIEHLRYWQDAVNFEKPTRIQMAFEDAISEIELLRHEIEIMSIANLSIIELYRDALAEIEKLKDESD